MEGEVNEKMDDYTHPSNEGAGNEEQFYHDPNATTSHDNENLATHDMSDADAQQLRMAAQLSREVQPVTTAEQESLHATSSNYQHQEYAQQSHQNDQHMMQSQQMQHMGAHTLPSYVPQMGSYPAHEASTQFSPIPEETTGARNKKKTSRACDECRRKKVKCDAREIEGQPGMTTVCSNCKRVNAQCGFSRQPMKRGPSKGYIKDLSDRLQAVEGVVRPRGASSDAPFTPTASNQPRSSPRDHTDVASQPQNGRKRKREATDLSGGHFVGFKGSNMSLPNSSTEHVVAEVNYNQYGPDGIAPRPEWPSLPERTIRDAQMTTEDQELSLELNEEHLSRYYLDIHPALPFLPHERSTLISQLESTTPELREAFLAAFSGYPRNAWTSLSVELDETHGFTRAENLISLQILLLVAIDASNSGPEGAQLTKRALAAAAAIAYEELIHINKCDESMLAMSDEETDELMARRIWWSLVVLDRFIASSTGSPGLVGDTAVTMLPIERRIVGRDLHFLHEISRVLGQVSAFHAVNKQSTTSEVTLYAAMIKTTLYSSLDSIQNSAFSRDFAEQYIPALVLTVSYWYARLLVAELNDVEHLSYQAAKGMYGVITLQGYRPSPLDYLFRLSIVRILVSMHDQDPAEIEEKLKVLRNMCLTNTGWDIVLQEQIAQVLPAPASTSKEANQGLQHLAELATAENGGGSHRVEDSNIVHHSEYHDRGDAGLSKALQDAAQNAEREARDSARENYVEET